MCDLGLVLCCKLVYDLSEADVSTEEAGEETSREDEEVLPAPHPEPQPAVALPVARRILKIKILCFIARTWGIFCISVQHFLYTQRD